MSRQPVNKQRAQGAVPGFPRLLADCLCLDFVNTREDVFKAHPTEFLPDFDALVLWGRHVGLLADDEVASARAWGAAHPHVAAERHARAIRLREALTSVFTALAQGGAPDPKAIETVKETYFQDPSALRLVQEPEGFRWRWDNPDAPIDRLLWCVSDSAIQLLMTGDPDRIRQCPGAGDCGSLFYDTSRNGTRRWCSMEGCGSRVKMRRQYARKVGRPDDGTSRA